jgi:hypothetical protein
MVTIWRMAAVAAVAMWVQSSSAQQPECRLYKVQSSSLNISKEPRGDAPYIDVLDNADVVCVNRRRASASGALLITRCSTRIAPAPLGGGPTSA